MFKLSLHLCSPSDSLASQVQRLAMDDLTTLSSVALAPSNPLYPLYQYVFGLEIHHYLQSMAGTKDQPVELLLAMDTESPGRMLGFALYLPALGAPQACTLLCLAVIPSHRRQGIGAALLEEMTARYPHAEATCSVATFDWFAAQGWHALGASGPQLVVGTRRARAAGTVRRLDLAPLFATLEVRQIHAYLLKQHGRKAMLQAEKQRDYRLDQLTWQAAELLRSRQA
ncbi:GNAT family N-acetyltransferase [Pseudomonas sp. DC3000-4b1]|uniref:GNAT family N-acetyltransferase n=1 Tax=unclassified Pseudomonas TaxID=196821 RepID=UPI003CF91117